MSFEIILSTTAMQHTQDAYDYYEQIQNDLGERFLNVLEIQYRKLQEQPQFYSFIAPESRVRSIAVPYFPYSIIFQIIDQQVLIIDVFNTHRNSRNTVNEPL